MTYSTFKDLDRGRVKYYDGSIHLWIKEHQRDWIVLKDAKGTSLVGRRVFLDERIDLGLKVCFPSHTALVGNCVISPNDRATSLESTRLIARSDVTERESYTLNGSEPHMDINVPITTSPMVEQSNDNPEIDCTSAVYDAISMGLDFSHGFNFAKEINNLFCTTVHPTRYSGHFTLVVSFARANFRISEDSAAIALEAVIGGFCGSLKVSSLRDRTFSFAVSNKLVGFHIYKLRKFSCKQFKCYFNLWGRGGPHWQSEFRTWQLECDKEWILVSPTKKRAQLGLAALKLPVPKSSIKSSNPTSRKLVFSESISYEACKGYKDPNCKALAISFGSFTAPEFPSTISDSNVLITQDIPSLHDIVEDSGQQGLACVIDDMAYRFWKCGRCLSMNHDTGQCNNKIRDRKSVV